MTARPEAYAERTGAILLITIDRPESRNAMTRAASTFIASALDELDAEPSLTVGVMTGAGGHFCSGMDLKRFLAGETAVIPGRGFGGLTARPPAKPLIAAVEGFAVAGGFELMLACDMAVAGRSAKFGLPEVKRGLIAKGGGLLRLPRRIPQAVAMELLLTGETFGAERAERLGLVNSVVPDGTALDQAMRLAGAIAANAPLAVAASKRVVVESQSWPADAWWQMQDEISDPVYASDDAREGSRAFAQKRAPHWAGQ